MSVATLPPVELPEPSELLAAPVSALADSELAEGLRRLGRLASQVEARRAEFIAEADRRDLARRQGSPPLPPG